MIYINHRDQGLDEPKSLINWGGPKAGQRAYNHDYMPTGLLYPHPWQRYPHHALRHS